MVPVSGSVDVTVCTAVWFSETLAVADEVIVGGSLTFVTEIVNACSRYSPAASVARTRIVNVLFALKLNEPTAASLFPVIVNAALSSESVPATSE